LRTRAGDDSTDPFTTCLSEPVGLSFGASLYGLSGSEIMPRHKILINSVAVPFNLEFGRYNIQRAACIFVFEICYFFDNH
jgi:tRNA C32,U32 (ribose-2'-O)-methylase TrmJ